MQKRPKLLRRDVKSLAEQIVTRTSPFFQRLDQDPIVRIVADADSMRRLQKALRREWRGNVQFCLVSPERALVVVAKFTEELLACPHCASPFERGCVSLAVEYCGRYVPLKPTGTKVWICVNGGREVQL